MSQKEFDDIIKNKLSSFSPSQSKADWSSFEKKMEADDHFDEVIKHKLQRFEVPFDPKSWKPLARRIESEFGWLNKVFRFKLVEFSFLLLITYFLNQLPLQLDPAKPIISNFGNILPPESQLSGIQIDDSNLNGSLVLPNQYKQFASLPPVQTKVEFKREQVDLKGKLNQSISSPKPKVEKTKVLEGTQAVAVHSLASLSPITNNTTEEFKKYVSYNFFYGADANRIVTPFDPENRFDKLDRYAHGYSLGLTVDLHRPNYTVQTGLIISNKHYSPRQVIYYAGSVKNGFFGKRLEDIELNILTVPLHLKKELIEIKNWKISALAGMAWNIALNADYKMQFKGTSDFNNYKSGILDNLSNSIRGKQLNKGWLEGGGFAENTYMSVDLGLSFEHPIGKRFNWFVQPTYRHTNRKLGKGLGPDQDIINTFSLYSGITFRLIR